MVEERERFGFARLLFCLWGNIFVSHCSVVGVVQEAATVWWVLYLPRYKKTNTIGFTLNTCVFMSAGLLVMGSFVGLAPKFLGVSSGLVGVVVGF